MGTTTGFLVLNLYTIGLNYSNIPDTNHSPKMLNPFFALIWETEHQQQFLCCIIVIGVFLLFHCKLHLFY